MTKHFQKLEIDSELFDDTLINVEPLTHQNHTEWEFLNIKVRDNPIYCFEIYMLVFDDGGVALSCQHFPSGKGKSKQAHYISTQHFENLITDFASWLDLLKRYKDAENILNSGFEKKYFDDFYEEIKLEDEDYETAPFDPERQELINIRLQCLLTAIQQTESIDADEKQDLIEYIEETTDSLGRLTKKQVMKKLSKIRAKIQKWGPKIIKQLGDALIKELAKVGVAKGMKILGDIFHNF